MLLLLIKSQCKGPFRVNDLEDGGFDLMHKWILVPPTPQVPSSPCLNCQSETEVSLQLINPKKLNQLTWP